VACDPKTAEWLLDHFGFDCEDDADSPLAEPRAWRIAFDLLQALAKERGVALMTVIEERFPADMARLGRAVAPPCNLPKTKRRRTPRRSKKDQTA
jgi:hypothetical protein